MPTCSSSYLEIPHVQLRKAEWNPVKELSMVTSSLHGSRGPRKMRRTESRNARYLPLDTEPVPRGCGHFSSSVSEATQCKSVTWLVSQTKRRGHGVKTARAARF